MNKEYETVKLGAICDVVSGSTPKTSVPEYWDGDRKWITPAEINESSVYIGDTLRHITEEGIKSAHLKRLPKGTVLLSSRAPIGKVAIVDSEMYCNQGFKNLICSSKIRNKYLFYYLKYNSNYLQSLGRGATFKEISTKIVENLVIELPPLNIQDERIAKLDTISKILNLNLERNKLLEDLAMSRFIEMFGDPVINPKSLPVFSLKELCSRITDGTHHSPENIDQGEYLYITAKNIKPDGIDLSKVTYVDEKTHSSIYSRCNPEYGDVLYIKDGVTTGIAAINTLNEPFSMLSSVALLKPDKSKVNSFWLTAALNNSHLYETIRRQMGGAAITRLTLKKIEKLTLPLPELSDQIAFSAFVKQVDKSKLAIQKSLDELETLKKSLMQEYFG